MTAYIVRFLSLSLLIISSSALAQTTLLNVSYDVARELYKEINPAFVAAWQKKSNQAVTINQSHGGSSKQVGAVAAGLEADVVTMNQASDLDFLASKNLIANDWRKAFPNNAAPYSSVSILLVRKGNPKGIKNWDDLVKPGIQVIVPNPKLTGNGRYTYLAAYGYAYSQNKNEAQAREFVRKLFANVPVLDGGGRGATTTFTQRGIGDVLATFENEAVLIEEEVGKGQFEVIYPSLTIEAPAPVAIVNSVATKHGTTDVGKAYLDFLYSDEGQGIIAKHYLRPINPAIFKKNAAQFPPVKTFTVDSLLGGWSKVMKEHFADGGVYDQISVKK